MENLLFWLAVDRYESKANFVYQVLFARLSSSRNACDDGVNQGGELSKSLMGGSSTKARRSTASQPPTVDAIQEEVNQSGEDGEVGQAVVPPRSPIKRRQSVVTSGAVYDLAEDIVRRFVLSDSPQQVNLPGSTRIAIEESFRRWGATNEPAVIPIGHVISNGSIMVNATESTKSVYTLLPSQGSGLSQGSFVELFAEAKKEVWNRHI